MDINKLVENYFAPKNLLTKEKLWGLFDEVLEEVEKSKTFVSLLNEAAQTQTLDWSSIPEIAISEIGWSQMETTAKGEQIPSEQRAQLLNFLTNISGEDLEGKLASLAEFYSGDDVVFASMIGNDNAGTIGRVMSYLVFYKTLTTIITNFNASSAGFAFESFLGVLLGGQQVPTGEGTIADLRTADGTPISLKLYAEASVEVGGSWTDLVRDVAKGLMQYVVVTKTFDKKGGPMDVNGTLDFYRFDFTLDNIMDIMFNSKVAQNQRLIELPRAFIDNPALNYDEILPGRSIVISPEELETLFVNSVKSEMGDDERADMLLRTLKWASNEALFVAAGGRQPGYSKFYGKRLNNIINDLVMNEEGQEGVFTPAEAAAVKAILIKANDDVIEYRKQKSSQNERGLAIKEIEFADAKTSREFYNSAEEDVKKRALMSTRGYLFTDKFKLNKTNVKRVASYSSHRVLPDGQSDIKIGSLAIGSSHVKAMLEKVSAIINEKVFDIFNNVKILTTNIQAYFAGGLAKDDQANNAIGAAQEIESKTEEVKAEK